MDTDVVVIGAGITGIYQLYRAIEAGFSATLLEAGDGVGGTWYWNRYPGARFDSESYTYGYLFSRDLFHDWEWQEHFAAQPETERYMNHVVDRFGLRPHIRFGRRVQSAVFDQASSTWRVTTEGGETYISRFVVAATGVLSIPYVPDFPGLDRYRGVCHHTGRWPAEPVDFGGKRVAVIGTSSSGVQVVPEVAPVAAQVTVFQRTANWCTPLNNRPITPEEQASLRADFDRLKQVLDTSVHGFLHAPHDRTAAEDPDEVRQEFFERMWSSPGFMKLTANYTDLLSNDETNAQWCAFVAGKIRAIVQDPVTAEKLIPTDHSFGEKRPPFVTGYFEAFNRPNVKLVDLKDTPILSFTETGIETSAGHEEFDIVVLATGFDFGTGALLRLGVVGRDGRTLAQHWADGPLTFLGVASHGFPNLFFPGGPHAAAGNNPRYNGDQVDFVTDVLVHARKNGIDTVEVTEEAEKRWTAMINRAAKRQSFGEKSYFFGTNIPGKPVSFLINSAGRPKLFSVVAEELSGEFPSFEMTAIR